MMSPPPRRHVLIAGASALLLPRAPARATPNDVAKLIAELVGEGTLRDGRVKLDLPVLVENGNAVSMTVSVDAPLQGPAALRSIDVFAEGNPLPHVARFTFGPRAGAPRVATRIRLATSQTVIAVAKLADGSCWRDSVDLIVTIAACIDGS
jgi:sulfur-oxidizing protein SoxY